jgi:hypothetical protein
MVSVKGHHSAARNHGAAASGFEDNQPGAIAQCGREMFKTLGIVDLRPRAPVLYESQAQCCPKMGFASAR